MAGSITVEAAAIQKGISCCRQSIQKLDDAAKKLQHGYQQAGSSGWNDQKYSALGGIIEECASSLRRPINELTACQGKLSELLKAINEYENIKL